MLRLLQPQRLSDGVVNELLDAIKHGRLQQGEKLPSERRLSEELGVSRVSVREGLRMLELLEVVEVRQGKGAFVVSRDVRPGGRLLRHWLLAHRDETLELLDVREALEASAAAAAAHRGVVIEVPGDVPHDQIERLVFNDLQFHNEVARSSGNPVLASLIGELNGVLEESRFAMFAIPGRPERSYGDHLTIAEAIRKRDSDGAHRAMQAHIAETRADVADLGHDPKGT
ncbi:MAG: FadR/GntR family transcriptional regulator [Actinomycetota bacterium]